MGSWIIEVEGHGCHHNKREDIDADLAFKDFVERLKTQGHTLKRATFSLTGQQDDMLATSPTPSEPSSK